MRKVVFIGRGLNNENSAGIHRYTLEILKELDKIISKDEVELIIPYYEKDDYGFDNIKVVNVGKKIYIGKFSNRVETYLFKNFYSYKYIKNNDAISVDLLLQFPIFKCNIIAIYDCRVNLFPEFFKFSKEQKHIRRAWLRHQNKAVKNCDFVVTDSNTVKSEIMDCYLNLESINVMYCGWQHFISIKEDDAILDKLSIRGKDFFFTLGSRFPHKNIKWIVAAAKQNPEIFFVISGKYVGDNSYESERPSNMVFSGRLSDQEIKTLMKQCKAFIQPSLYEGFGIPPLEAMSVGTDCILSDIPVFREIYGDSVWYIDPYEYADINFDVIMSKQKESNDIVLKKYSWKNSAHLLWDCIKRMDNSK